MFKKVKENKKGFTLAELLIVVAIIAVLVAISIPIFTNQLEKSRDAVTMSNVRAAYAEASAAYLTEESGNGATYDSASKTVEVAGIQIKGQSDNGAFNDANQDLPFTLGNGVAAALDNGKTAGTITLVFSWDTNGVCTANKKS